MRRKFGAVAQLGEHQAGSLRVVGSNPTGSISLLFHLCEGGGTGRRARFRIWWDFPCGFKSRPSHKS